MKKLFLFMCLFVSMTMNAQEVKEKSTMEEFVVELEKTATNVDVSSKYIEFYLKDEYRIISLRNRVSWEVEKTNNTFYLTGTKKNKKGVVTEKVRVSINLDKQVMVVL